MVLSMPTSQSSSGLSTAEHSEHSIAVPPPDTLPCCLASGVRIRGIKRKQVSQGYLLGIREVSISHTGKTGFLSR